MRGAAVGLACVLAACAGSPPVVPAEPVAEAAPPPVPALAEPLPEPVPTVAERPRVPAFAFPALGDTATVFTPATFAGRFVLIDVWASWCVPCHVEIPRIAVVHAEHADTLDVLSVSLDVFPDDVAAFRARVAPMDWHHAFVGDRFDHPSLVALGVDRLPTALLIGPDGTVRARGGALRGALLRPTVDREVAAPRSDAHAP